MATIGIDLTPLQGPHRMRGVGSTVINVLLHVSKEDKAQHKFVFYTHEEGRDEALKLIDAKSFPGHEVRSVAPARPLPPSIKTPQGLAYLPRRIKELLLDRKLGTKRITELDGIDAFLQFEQDIIPPSPDKVRASIVAYDLIPYVLESDYLWSYKTARKAHNYSRRGALKAQVKRNLYLATIRSAMQRAHKVIAISEHTKKDFIKYVGIPPEKISVCYLGVSDKKITKQAKPSSVERYIGTSWGDVKINTKLPDTPFLLFVGGADPRRKLADLVHAFNLLRAQGHDLHLVLAGDTMLGPESTPNNDIRKSLMQSSYSENIYMLGFVNDQLREWLYQNALAFVYPSTYEGFGLPILEAMKHSTPVITYKNSCMSEVAGDAAAFANDYMSLYQQTLNLLVNKDIGYGLEQKGLSRVKAFSWAYTSKLFIKNIMEIKE